MMTMWIDAVINRFATATALDAREAINIAIAVFALTTCCLFGRYAFQQWRKVGYSGLDWPTKLSIGLLLVSAGEFIRSSTIWNILHFEGMSGTYLSEIGPLLVALALTLIGWPCVIRVMTPERLGCKLWIGALAVVVVLIAINFLS